ncbi:MAG TPA: ABC transporter ATP-binding protein [Nitrospira sp.]|nr:ABC transporter ATP-binding protein [Nitrospira sp.]
MSSECAIRLQGITKTYRLYRGPVERVKQWLRPLVHHSLGKCHENYYREHVALDDVSLEIKRGETLGIIGRNGSGKSTLLQIISGIVTPAKGTVWVKGRVAALLELGAGFHPEFTGRENVYINAGLFGLSESEIDERFDDIASFADIGPYITHPVKTYSSGMFVRLAFAIIAHVKADILLIDEALAVGDAFFVQKCMRFLRKFMDHGTVVLVSHDTTAVLTLCRKALLLDQGRALRIGEAKQVCDYYLRHLYAIHAVPDDRESSIDRSSDLTGSLGSLSNNEGMSIGHLNGRHKLGDSKAVIEQVSLTDAQGGIISCVTQRERLRLSVRCKTAVQLFSPLVGFLVRDRFGQILFGQNTNLIRPQTTLSIPPGTRFLTEFEFIMPMLGKGSYSISVALAEGTQAYQVSHHWVNDAVVFESMPKEHCFGFVGVELIHAYILQQDCQDETPTPSPAL